MKDQVYEIDCLQVRDLKYACNLTKQSVIEVGKGVLNSSLDQDPSILSYLSIKLID